MNTYDAQMKHVAFSPRTLSAVVCNTAEWTISAGNNSLLLSVQPFLAQAH